MTSIGFFEESAQSTRLVADWVRDEHFAAAMPNPPKITTGTVVAHKNAAPAALAGTTLNQRTPQGLRAAQGRRPSTVAAKKTGSSASATARRSCLTAGSRHLPPRPLPDSRHPIQAVLGAGRSCECLLGTRELLVDPSVRFGSPYTAHVGDFDGEKLPGPGEDVFFVRRELRLCAFRGQGLFA